MRSYLHGAEKNVKFLAKSKYFGPVRIITVVLRHFQLIDCCNTFTFSNLWGILQILTRHCDFGTRRRGSGSSKFQAKSVACPLESTLVKRFSPLAARFSSIKLYFFPCSKKGGISAEIGRRIPIRRRKSVVAPYKTAEFHFLHHRLRAVFSRISTASPMLIWKC